MHKPIQQAHAPQAKHAAAHRAEATEESKAEEKAADKAEHDQEVQSKKAAQAEANLLDNRTPEFIAAVRWEQTRFHRSLPEAVGVVESQKNWPTPAKAAEEKIDPDIEKEAKALEGKSPDWVNSYKWQRTRYGKSVDDAAKIASAEEGKRKAENAKA